MTMERTSLFAGLCALALSLTFSCDNISIENDRARSRDETMTRDSTAGGKASGGGVLAVAVKFPRDYDWRRDSCYGAVNGKLVLMAGKKELLTLDAGPGTAVSLDADRHHIVGSRLYTEACGPDGTVYCCDGKELFASPDREVLKGIYSSGGDLYTLSESLSGAGIVLRKNFQELFSRKGGQVHGSLSDPSRLPCGALTEEDGEPCFIYYSDSGGKRRWYRVQGKEESELPLPLGVRTVYDIGVWDGIVCIACLSTAGRAPVLFCGDELHDFWWTLAVKKVESDFRLFREDGRTKMYGTYHAKGRGETAKTAHWSEDGIEGLYPLDCSIFRGESYISRQDGSVREIVCGGKNWKLDGEWRLASPHCVAWTDGGAVVALTPAGEGNPAIWKDGKLESCDFNGYFSAVAMVE